MEPGHTRLPAGWIEVICGSMFSGKTEELLRRIRRAEYAHQRIQLFKPHIDTRYSPDAIVSHNANSFNARTVARAADIPQHTSQAEVVGIDEAQFFDEEIVAVVRKLANTGKRVIVAGLDMDYKGNPFGPMPQLLAIAEFITKLHAICVRTGGLAHFSYRKPHVAAGQVKLGAHQQYEPLSREAYLKATQHDQTMNSAREPAQTPADPPGGEASPNDA